jgi:hypothetical protein
MASITERTGQVWLPPTSDGQVEKVLRGGKKDVRAQVAAWEAKLRCAALTTIGATVTDLLQSWLEVKQSDWQPTSARDYTSRCRFITEAIGSVRLVGLDPMRLDAWMAEMRRSGVGGRERSAAGSPPCAPRSAGASAAACSAPTR